ncbi:hypothetical protein [Peribacillus simplex]
MRNQGTKTRNFQVIGANKQAAILVGSGFIPNPTRKTVSTQ